MHAAPKIRFYFDYISPNAYVAWTQLPALAARYGATVEPVPVLYAALLDALDQRGPGESPPKLRWMMKNLARKALRLGIPLGTPAFLPFNPLLALRVTLLAEDPAQRDALIEALFQAVWVRGLHVSEPAVVERILREQGLPTTWIENAQASEIKERLRIQTGSALARGVFGVPTMDLEGDLFWGYDDFPHLELSLAGQDPLAGAAWDARLPEASATRRGK